MSAKAGSQGCLPLSHAQQAATKSPERRRLYVKTVDLSLNCCRQNRVGSSPAELSELLFEVLLRLRRDIPPSLFLLEGGYEPAGCGHWSSIG